MADKVAELVQAKALTEAAVLELEKSAGGTADVQSIRRALQVRQEAASMIGSTPAQTSAYQTDLRVWLEALVPVGDESGFDTKLLSRLIVLERMYHARIAAVKERGAARKALQNRPRKVARSVEAGVSTAFSILMAFMEVSCLQNEEMCGMLLARLAPILAALEPLCLRDSDDTLPDVIGSGVRNLVTFLRPFVGDGAAGPRADNALEALLCVGVASGSLNVLLNVAQALLRRAASGAGGGLASDSRVVDALQQLAGRDGNFRISPPRSLLAAIPSSNPALYSATSTHSAVATDGHFLYVHNGTGLSKIGTGNGNVTGKVYLHNPEFYPGSSGSLACVGEVLYFRSPSVAPMPLEAVSTATLQRTDDSKVAVSSCPLPPPSEASTSYLIGDGRLLYCVRESGTSAGVAPPTAAAVQQRAPPPAATPAGGGGGGGVPDADTDDDESPYDDEHSTDAGSSTDSSMVSPGAMIPPPPRQMGATGAGVEDSVTSSDSSSGSRGDVIPPPRRSPRMTATSVELAAADGGAASAAVREKRICIDVVDPLTMRKQKTIVVRNASAVGMGPDDLEDGNGALRALYTNGQRVVALLCRTTRSTDSEASPPAFIKVVARTFNLDSGNVESEVDCGTLSQLGIGDTKKSVCDVFSSMSATYDPFNNQTWVVAPRHAQQTLSRWRNVGVAPSIRLDTAERYFDYSPEAVLDKSTMAVQASRIVPGERVDPFATAVTLLAHIDRLGGEEGAGAANAAATVSSPEADAVPLEEAFVIEVHSSTCQTLCELAQLVLSLVGDASGDVTRAKSAAYLLLAVLRLLRAQLARVSTAGADIDALHLRSVLAPLQDTLMQLIKGASLVPDPEANERIANEAWALLASGFDLFAGEPGSQGKFVVSLLSGDVVSTSNSSFRAQVSGFIGSVARRPRVSDVLLGADGGGAASMVTSLLSFVADESKASLSDADTTRGAAAAASAFSDEDEHLSRAASATALSPVLLLLKSLSRDLILRSLQHPSAFSGSLTSFVKAVSTASHHLLDLAVPADPSGGLSAERLGVLEASIVGSLLPELCMSLLLVISNGPLSVTVELMDPLVSLLSAVNRAACALRQADVPAEQLHKARGKPVKVKVGEATHESAHPYPDDMETEECVEIAGADYIEYTFSRESETEVNYDYLTVATGPKTDETAQVIGKYSGPTVNWPAKPVRANGSALYLRFHSDGSGHMFGYVMNLIGYKELKLQSGAHLPWLLDLLKVLSRVVSCGISALIVAEPLMDEEADPDARRWLTSPLLRNALEDAERGSDAAAARGAMPAPPAAIARAVSEGSGQTSFVVDADAKSRFLDDLVIGNAGSSAMVLFEQIKRKAGRFASQGGTEADRAHRAVLAALLKHNGLITEALTFARLRDRRASAMSPSLARVFERAKAVRQWVVHHRNVTRQSFQQVADTVCTKVGFLLKLRPFCDSPMASSEPSGGPRGVSDADSQSPGAAGMTSPVKWLKLKRQLSDTARKARLVSNTVEAWSHGHDAEERDTPDESIIAFVKSPTEVANLHVLLNRREQRVVQRATGVRLAAELLSTGAPSTAIVNDVLRGVSNAMGCLMKAPTSAESAQYLCDLEACVPEQVLRLRMAFHELLSAVLAYLPDTGETTEHKSGEDETVVLLALRCLAVVLDSDDHAFIAGCNLFPRLAQLMCSAAADGAAEEKDQNDGDGRTGGAAAPVNASYHAGDVVHEIFNNPDLSIRNPFGGLIVEGRSVQRPRREADESDSEEVDETCGIAVPHARFVVAGSVFAEHPVDPFSGAHNAVVAVGYFELSLVAIESTSAASIGFVADIETLPNHMPGWQPGSYGYQSDDGTFFAGNATGANKFGPVWEQGDVIGAGINFQSREVFVTRNGKLVGIAANDIEEQALFPAVGLYGDCASVDVNFGPDFAFDLSKYVTGIEPHGQEEQGDKKQAATASAAEGVFRFLATNVLSFGCRGSDGATDNGASFPLPPLRVNRFGRSLSSFVTEHVPIEMRGSASALSAVDVVLSVVDSELERCLANLKDHNAAVSRHAAQLCWGIDDTIATAGDRELSTLDADSLRIPRMPDDVRAAQLLSLLLAAGDAGAAGFGAADGASSRRAVTLKRVGLLLSLLRHSTPRLCRLVLRLLGVILPRLTDAQFDKAAMRTTATTRPASAVVDGEETTRVSDRLPHPGARVLLEFIGSSVQPLSGNASHIIAGAPDWSTKPGSDAGDGSVAQKARLQSLRSMCAPANALGRVSRELGAEAAVLYRELLHEHVMCRESLQSALDGALSAIPSTTARLVAGVPLEAMALRDAQSLWCSVGALAVTSGAGINTVRAGSRVLVEPETGHIGGVGDPAVVLRSTAETEDCSIVRERALAQPTRVTIGKGSSPDHDDGDEDDDNATPTGVDLVHRKRVTLVRSTDVGAVTLTEGLVRSLRPVLEMPTAHIGRLPALEGALVSIFKNGAMSTVRRCLRSEADAGVLVAANLVESLSMVARRPALVDGGVATASFIQETVEVRGIRLSEVLRNTELAATTKAVVHVDTEGSQSAVAWSRRSLQVSRGFSAALELRPVDGVVPESSNADEATFGSVTTRATTFSVILATTKRGANSVRPAAGVALLAVRFEIRGGSVVRASTHLWDGLSETPTSRSVTLPVRGEAAALLVAKIHYVPGMLSVFVTDADVPVLRQDVDVSLPAKFPVGQANLGGEAICGVGHGALSGRIEFAPVETVSEGETLNLPELPADELIVAKAAPLGSAAGSATVAPLASDDESSEVVESVHLTLVWTDGRQRSDETAATNVVLGATSAIHSTRPASGQAHTMVFQVADAEQVLFSSATLKAPLTGSAAPVGEAIVFVSSTMPKDAVQATAAFADATYASYAEFAAQLKRDGKVPRTDGSRLEPAAYLRLEPGAATDTVDLDFRVTGEFVVVRFLRTRADATDGSASGLDIGSFSMRGVYYDDARDARPAFQAPLTGVDVLAGSPGAPVPTPPEGYESLAVMRHTAGSRCICLQRGGSSSTAVAYTFSGTWRRNALKVQAGADAELGRPADSAALLRLHAQVPGTPMAGYSGPVSGTLHWSSSSGTAAGALRWDDAVKGPDIVISENGMQVTRTDSSGWGMVRSECAISRPTYVEMEVVSNDSSNAYFGVMREDYTELNGSGGAGTWKLQADNYLYCEGRHVGNATPIRTGNTVGLDITPGGAINFFIDGTKHTMEGPIAKAVRVFVCFGANNQVVRLRPGARPPPGAKAGASGGSGCSLNGCVAVVTGTLSSAGLELVEQSLLKGSVEGWKPAQYSLGVDDAGFSGAWTQVSPGDLPLSGKLKLKATTGQPITSLHVVSELDDVPAGHVVVPLVALPAGGAGGAGAEESKGDDDEEEEDSASVQLPPMKWDTAALGPDCAVTSNGLEFTRNSSSGWGTQVADTWITTPRYIEVDIVANDSNYLYIGVVGPGFTDRTNSMAGASSWCMQADRYLYREGSDVGRGESIRSGLRLGMMITPGAELQFYRDGRKVASIGGLPSRVVVACCLGSSDQRIRINNDCGPGPQAKKLSLRKNVSSGVFASTDLPGMSLSPTRTRAEHSGDTYALQLVDVTFTHGVHTVSFTVDNNSSANFQIGIASSGFVRSKRFAVDPREVDGVWFIAATGAVHDHGTGRSVPLSEERSRQLPRGVRVSLKVDQSLHCCEVWRNDSLVHTFSGIDPAGVTPFVAMGSNSACVVHPRPSQAFLCYSTRLGVPVGDVMVTRNPTASAVLVPAAGFLPAASVEGWVGDDDETVPMVSLTVCDDEDATGSSGGIDPCHVWFRRHPSLPSRMAVSGKHISLDAEGLRAIHSGMHRDRSAVLADVPIPQHSDAAFADVSCGVVYCEYTLSGLPESEPCAVAVGVAPASFPLDNRLLGWEYMSFAVHGDDGFRVNGLDSAVADGEQTPGEAWPGGKTFGNGDTVGCGVCLETRDIFFTKNGEMLGVAFDGTQIVEAATDLQEHESALYLAAAANNRCEIEFNFGSSPFLFDPATAVTMLTERGELSFVASTDADDDQGDGGDGGVANLFPDDGVGTSTAASEPASYDVGPRKPLESPSQYKPVIVSDAVKQLSPEQAAWFTLSEYPLHTVAGMVGYVAGEARKLGHVKVRLFLPDIGRTVCLDIPLDLLQMPREHEEAKLKSLRGAAPLISAVHESAVSLRTSLGVATTLEARSAIVALLANWPDRSPLSPSDALGGVPNLVKLLKLQFASEHNESEAFSQAGSTTAPPASRLRDTVASLLVRERDSGSTELIDALISDMLSALSGQRSAPEKRRRRITGTTSKSVVVESPHPYLDNSDVRECVSFPGATSLEITFSGQEKTESGYDWLGFTNSDYSRVTGGKWSGDNSSWPKPQQKIVIKGSKLYYVFKSDGSTHYWGYKFTVTAKGIPQGDSPQIPGNMIADTAVLQQRPEWGFWVAEFLLQPPNSTTPHPLAFSQPVVDSLVGFMLGPSQTPLLRARCVTLLRRVFDGIAAGKHSDPDLNLDKVKPLGTKLSKLVGNVSADVWRKPFVQSCVELLAAAATASELLRGGHHEGGGGGGGGASESKSAAGERESKDGGDDDAGTDVVESTPTVPPPSVPLTFATDKLGRDIQLSNSNRSCTRTDSSGWGSQLCNTWFKRGVHTVELLIERHEGAYLYVGVVGRDYTDWSSSLKHPSSHIIQADGDLYSAGSSKSREQPRVRLTSGSVVKLEIDMNRRRMLMSINESTPEVFESLPDEVCVAVCFGGNDQLVTIKSGKAGGPAGSGGIVDMAKTLSTASHTLWLLDTRTPDTSARLAVQIKRAVAEQFEAGAVVESTSGSVNVNSEGEVEAPAGGGFPSFKATGVELKGGKWYYEAHILTNGCMQFGWANEEFTGDSGSGQGVGDDTKSWAYDGFRQLRWNGASSRWGRDERWSVGDVVGCAVDLDAGTMLFSINGDFSAPMGRAFGNVSVSRFLVPAGSLSRGERVRVVFKRADFSFAPPDEDFRAVAESVRSSSITEDDVAEHVVGAAVSRDEDEGLVARLNLVAQQKRTTVADLVLADALQGKSQGGPKRPLLIRAALLRAINELWQAALPLVNLYDYSSALRRGEASHACDGFAAELLRNRGLLFTTTKMHLLEQAIAGSHTSSRPTIKVNRIRAMRAAEQTNREEAAVLKTLFGQIFRQLQEVRAAPLRNDERAWKVKFAGEGSIDAGGPYHESVSQVCTDLMSPAVPLFMPTPNNLRKTGTDRGRYMARPSATQPWELAMFEFVGRFMGIALRTRKPLDLNLSRLFWRRLVGQEVTKVDIKASDADFAMLVDLMGEPGDGMTEEEFALNFDDQMYTCMDSEDRTVDLVPGGAERRLEFHERGDYVRLALQARASECDAQIAAIRRGIGAIVPGHLLPIFSGEELEYMVCGTADFDVALLKKYTEYKGPSESDQHIVWFWEVLESFTAEERVRFLRFVSGRTRLPTVESELSRSNGHLIINNHSR